LERLASNHNFTINKFFKIISKTKGWKFYDEKPLLIRKCFYCGEVKDNCLVKIVFLGKMEWDNRHVCRDCYIENWFDIQED
jgi:hypothetical protein